MHSVLDSFSGSELWPSSKERDTTVHAIKLGYQFAFYNPPGSGRSFADLHSEMLHRAERAEELGFEALGLMGHHFSNEEMISWATQ